MKKKERLERLNVLAQLILDQHLAKLQASAAARNSSIRRLEGLAPTLPDDLDTFTLATSILSYERWADARRSEINITLARQTATWLEARSAAQTALGRSDVLKRIGDGLTR